MDLVEQLLGWAPDGGDGTLELMIVIGVAVALALGLLFRGRIFSLHSVGRAGPDLRNCLTSPYKSAAGARGTRHALAAGAASRARRDRSPRSTGSAPAAAEDAPPPRSS